MNNDLVKRSDTIAEIYKARTPDIASHQYAELFINAICRAPSADTFEITKKTLIEAVDNAEIVGDIVENIINRPRGTYTNSESDVEWYATEATCNLCGEKWMGARNFCPNCGIRMKGADDETNY